MFVNINGIDVYYEQIGSGDDLVILHGWGYGGELLSGLANAVSDTYRVTLIDMPGNGKTKEPQNKITVYDYGEILYSTLEALNIKSAYFLGHSFGCRLLILLASKHPERVKKLLLCGAAGIRDKRTAGYYFKTLCYKAAKLFVKTFAPKKYAKWRQSKGSEDYKKLSDNMKATFSSIVNEDLTYLLKDIKAPTFLIFGENDTATPVWMAEVMEKNIPDCAKIIYRGRTHYAFLEEPSRTVAILRTFFN